MAPISREREQAWATYPAELRTVGDHTRLDVAIGGDYIAKPATATHIQIQSISQNLRYTIDDSEAVGAGVPHGFQLAAGSISLIPCPNLGISIAEEAAGAVVQYQWVR